MKIIDSVVSGNVIKFLQMTDDNIVTETAFIEEKDRNIICFASQLGCPIGCKICYNGIFKNYQRNLTKEEIIKQCSNVVCTLDLDKKDKYILFSCMGVGEALLNYENVVSAIKELNILYPNSRFALATTGVKPELIKQLGIDLNDIEHFKLTISLHSANDKIRRNLIPTNVSLDEIKKRVEVFKRVCEHQVEYNYVLLDNINDKEENALDVINFLNTDDQLKISSFNEIEGSKLRKSHRLEQFKKALSINDINYYVFDSKGTDIEVGCGQMITHYNQKTKVLKKGDD